MNGSRTAALAAALALAAAAAARADTPAAPAPLLAPAAAAPAPAPAPAPAATSPAPAPAAAAPAPLPAAASPTAPPGALLLPAGCESPEEIAARVRYERAIRAEADGRLDDAEAEAKATVAAAGPSTRFAEAGRALLARVQARRGAGEPSESAGGALTHRVELVTTATGIGLYSGILAAVAGNTGSQATAGILMLSTGAAFGLSLAASSGRVVPSAYAPMLALGSGFGTWALLAGLALGDHSPDNPAGAILGAELVGAGLGLASAWAFDLTGGDSGAASDGAVFGGLLPGLLVGMGATDYHPILATALVGSALGMVLLPIANQKLRWSRSRWNLIFTGGAVGALFGGGLLVLGDARSQAAICGGVAGGIAAGLLLSGWLTDGFSPDEARRGSTALLESRPGEGLRLGSVLGAAAPAFLQRGGAVETGVQLRAYRAQF